MRLVGSEDVQFEVEAWETLAARQAALTGDDAITPDSFDDGDGPEVLALFDVVDDQLRRLYACTSDESIFIFDDNGQPVPDSDLVENGTVLFFDFVEAWRKPFYALPEFVDGEWKPARRERPESPQDEPSDWRQFVRENARIKAAYGVPAEWNSALVVRQSEQEGISGWVFAYDDGDLKWLDEPMLERMWQAKGLLPAVEEEKGVVGNTTGHAVVSGFVNLKERGGKSKTVGVLVGATEKQVFGQTIHMSHFAVTDEGVWPQPKGGAQSLQDRLGVHTFRRGDLVDYQKREEGQPAVDTVVYGVLQHEAEEGGSRAQADKMLVLYELESRRFFLGSWPSWKRMPLPEFEGASFNCDDNRQVRHIGIEQNQVMLGEWTDGTLHHIDSLSKAQRAAQATPPTLQVLLDDAAEAEKKAADNATGEWRHVSPPEGAQAGGVGVAFVNLGGQLERWTNDEVVATRHRVVAPENPAEALRPRFVIALFCDADTPTLLECLPQFTSAARPPKYAPMTSGDYKALRLGAQTSV